MITTVPGARHWLPLQKMAVKLIGRADVLTENKKRKHLRGSASGEKTAKKKKDWKKWKTNEETGSNFWEL